MRAQLRRFITSGEGDFNDLALGLFARQRETNPDYAAFCGDADPQTWQQIPAVPVALFRDLDLTTFAPADATVTFRTSGTTGRRGVVRLRDTVLYDLGARLWAERLLGPIPPGGVSLVTHTAASSLGHMCAAFCPGLQRFFVPGRGVDADGAWAALSAATEPVFVPGTAFAFADLLAASGAVVHLPPGSILMVTGGFKGRRRSMDADGLLRRLQDQFPGTRRVGEYGMTELASQLWSLPLGGAFQAPPWMRVVAVDPWTGAPAERGLLRFFDLANDQTVVAIETRDVGEVYDNNRVRLMGRLPGAPPRGCSLTVEEAAAPPSPERVILPVPAWPRAPLPSTQSARPDDQARVRRVLAVLDQLRELSVASVAEGVSAPVARQGLTAAIDGITEEGLLRELAVAGRRPATVSVVCAEGVFTAPLEWAAVYAAAGIDVLLKAPVSAPRFLYAVAEAFAAAGFPMRATISRDLADPDVVVTFGADESLAAVQAAWPAAKHVGFGHRFSVAFAASADEADAIARDVVMYDGRGCMAPVAIFAPDDLADAIAEAVADALSTAPPRGVVPAALGPEWRRRVGLARARGTAREGPDWAVLTMPTDGFTPLSLPRMAVIHPVASADALTETLSPWRHQLSTLAATSVETPMLSGVAAWFPRQTALGEMQTPRLPRRHDGVRILESVLRMD
ncbi:MAG: acyl-CoA reductase [Myxococcota bacterium]